MAEKIPDGNFQINSRPLRRLLLASHSRGAMLLCLGGHQHVADLAPAPSVDTNPTRAALFGAPPMPKGSQ